MCVCFEIGDNRTCLKDSFKRESRAEGNLWGRDGALPRTSSDLWAHLRSNSWFVRGLADGRHFVTVSCGRWFCPVQLINCDVTWSNSVQTAFISSFNMHRNCFRYFWICEGELFPLRNLTVKKRRVENAEIARFQACDVQRSVRSALVSAPPPHTQNRAASNAVLPDLFGTRDQFYGRQIFHRPRGWGAVSGWLS